MPRETTTRVVAAVVESDGRFLVGQRPAHKRHGGLWEFPGGKVHDGEIDAAAVSRELSEELGVAVSGIGRVLLTSVDGASGFEIRFVETSIVGSPQAIEHTALCWARPNELAEMQLAPTDAEFARTLRFEKRQEEE